MSTDNIEMAERLRFARVKANFRSAAEAAEAMDVPYATYSAHENGNRGLTTPVAQRYGAFFGVSPAWLLAGDGPYAAGQPVATMSAPDVPRRRSKLHLLTKEAVSFSAFANNSGRIPVFGLSSAGDDGRFTMNGQKIADVFRPPPLEGVPDAYATYVHGDSMFPRYESGETVWVNPHIPPRRDDYVVAQVETDDIAEPAGYVKRFKSLGDELVLEQLNPPKLLRFPRQKVQKVHKIVFSGVS